jgi:hypothetical protein
MSRDDHATSDAHSDHLMRCWIDLHCDMEQARPLHGKPLLADDARDGSGLHYRAFLSADPWFLPLLAQSRGHEPVAPHQRTSP